MINIEQISIEDTLQIYNLALNQEIPLEYIKEKAQLVTIDLEKIDKSSHKDVVGILNIYQGYRKNSKVQYLQIVNEKNIYEYLQIYSNGYVLTNVNEIFSMVSNFLEIQEILNKFKKS